jgi:23S rRNA (adenine-N6)-dimethyltransferase
VPAGGPPRWWGWYRLGDSWARRVVADAKIDAGDLVVDIGAGTGALTAPLVRSGARVVAVELHRGRADELRRRFAEDRVTVVRADASHLRLPRQPFRVVANPPFGITTPLLRRLLAPGSRLLAADLVLPRPVAMRWASGRGPGAGRWLRDYDLRLGRRVPATAFRPEAPMPCTVLVIRQRSGSQRK